jgi:chorismate-pyruvate lyase
MAYKNETLLHPDMSSTLTGEYDPLGDLFVAQAQRPPQLARINLRALSPFLRALLTIDGTVTKYIEAYTMEPIEVTRISQEFRQLPADHAWLEAPAGTQVIAREVLLRGKYSQKLYAYASSLLVPSRLPEDVQKGLDVQGGSLGRILLNSRLETFREVLWYGMEQPPRLPVEINQYTSSKFVSRTYRIFANRLPIMLINEKFPSTEDEEVAHE